MTWSSRFGKTATTLLMKPRNSARRRRLECVAMTLAVAPSNAASKIVARCPKCPLPQQQHSDLQFDQIRRAERPRIQLTRPGPVGPYRWVHFTVPLALRSCSAEPTAQQLGLYSSLGVARRRFSHYEKVGRRPAQVRLVPHSLRSRGRVGRAQMKISGVSLDKANDLCHSSAMPAFAGLRSTSYLDSLLSPLRESAALEGGSPAPSLISNAQQTLLVCMIACVVAGVCGALGH
jgi:hypothetical protein